MTGRRAEDGLKKRRKAETAGRRAEWIAALLLRVQGFAILERRFKAPSGEVDLVAKRGRLLVFAEVKSRERMDDALAAVTPAGRRRVSAGAGMFLARRPDLAACDMRYDIIAVSGWRLRHIKAAWIDDA